MIPDPRRAEHTIIVSDLHLTEVEEPDPDQPLWMRHKHRDLIIDDCFARFLAFQKERLPGPIELVLNGDVFDFDAVLSVPAVPAFHVSWLERRRGLAPEQAKSLHKIQVILRDHARFIQALREWMLEGHRLVIVVGNHDVELLWRDVQLELLAALDLPAGLRRQVRICPWFYISNGDTLVEHGSQYDAYCVCPDPLHPTIRVGGRELMRVPFGDLAGRLMLNGMGLFNPYVESTFIKPLHEYVVFFFRDLARVQPLLGWTWLWSAVFTLVLTLRDGFRPAVRDPFTLERRENQAAESANASAGMLRALRQLRVHGAVFKPWMILRELWLDRALILAIIVFTSFQAVGFLNLFGPVSPWWALLIFVGLLPPFALYARSVRSDVTNANRVLKRRIPQALRITGTRRAVIGHTHEEGHLMRGGVELLNTGTWSAAFEDAACTRPFGRKCYAWVQPDPAGGEGRVAQLYEWRDPGTELLSLRVEPMTRLSRLRELYERLPGRRGGPGRPA